MTSSLPGTAGIINAYSNPSIGYSTYIQCILENMPSDESGILNAYSKLASRYGKSNKIIPKF